MNIPHIPVLLSQTLDVFKDLQEGYFVDCTCGFGGHSEAILKQFPMISLIALDQDAEALSFAKKRLEPFKERVRFINQRASEALKMLEEEGIKVSGLLADIGVSSYQLDQNARGFNFQGESLDMRMNQTQEKSAFDVVNYYPKNDLERIFREYGEERFSKKISEAIINRRKEQKFTTSKELAQFIATLVPKSKIHGATKVFQAIRIEVNNELNELEQILDNALKNTKSGSIIGIIGFHSLEDRIVKNRFREWSKSCVCDEDAFRCECGGKNEKGKAINKKPLVADAQEIRQNPRSRSAKLRAFLVK